MKKIVKENLEDIEKDWEEEQERDIIPSEQWKVEVHDYAASNLRDYDVDSVEELRNLAYDVLDRIEHDPEEGDVEEAMESISSFVNLGPGFEFDEIDWEL